MSNAGISLPDGYGPLLESLKRRIRTAQIQAAVAVNRELILLYWNIGFEIRTQQRQQGWGAKIIDRLAFDLRHDLPDMKGLSTRNLKYMRAFAEAWPNLTIVQEALAQLPWHHNITLIEKLKDAQERLWYASEAILHGWSRNVLVHQIETHLYQRQGQAQNNFDRTLPPPQSELARQLLKDPYCFDFLALGSDLEERNLELGLINHIRDFLLELGKGFAFVGSQYKLSIAGQDYYLDLLFYHLRLRCYIAIDLKIEEFKPEFAGKMNFYLSAIDDLIRGKEDRPSIGMIICKDRNRVIVEYALRDTSKPMGVAQYRLAKALPKSLAKELPTLDDLAKDFPRFSLLELRLQIELALSARATLLGLVPGDMSIGTLLALLQHQNALPKGTENLNQILNILNSAAHMGEIPHADADEALKTGSEILKKLKQIEL